MKIGYARVSTQDQNLDLQIQDLKQAGCEKIFEEKISSVKKERPALTELLSFARKDDVIVVWKLDRLGRSLKHLVSIVSDLQEKGIHLKSINDPIDTTSSHGKFVFNLFASLAEFEKDLIRERTMAGLKAARARGRVGGKPKGLSDKAQATACAAEALYKEQKLSVQEIANKLNISKTTLYAYLRYRNVQIGVA